MTHGPKECKTNTGQRKAKRPRSDPCRHVMGSFCPSLPGWTGHSHSASLSINHTAVKMIIIIIAPFSDNHPQIILGAAYKRFSEKGNSGSQSQLTI